MKLVITAAESARLDAASSEPVATLMDRAGLAVALAAVGMGAGYGSRVSVLAGKGNNGGDGYVAAAYLAKRGCQVTVHRLGDPKGDDSPARHAAAGASAAGAVLRDLDLPDRTPDLVIDALFGVGFSGRLPEETLPWMSVPAPVLAVDVPSGLEADTGTCDGPCFTAHHTITFHAYKPGHFLGEGPERCGVVELVDIGLAGGEPEFLVCESEDAPLVSRSRTAHKWSAGSVLVVGGGPGMTGAALLAARAALASGAGAAAVACPAAQAHTYASLDPEMLTIAIGLGERFNPADVPQLLERAERFDVMVIGPGLGPDRRGFVASTLRHWPKKAVIDADGLNALSSPGDLVSLPGDIVLTPHAGEFRRLADTEASYQAAQALAQKTDTTVLLKGNPTFVASPQDTWAVTSGGPELATIGTGDVLAGMIGAFWAGGLAPAVAARSAAHWHGAAGARAADAGVVTANRLSEAVAAVVGGGR